MDIQKYICDYLKKYKRKTIELILLQNSMAGDVELKDFYQGMKDVISKGILVPRSKSKNSAGFALKYSIIHGKLYEDVLQELNQMEMKLNHQISLEYYYLHPNEWLEDREYIEKININLQKKPEIFEVLYLPELSLHLVNDEKWIEYKNGKKILQKIKLWEILNPSDRHEPIAFGVNIQTLIKNKENHLPNKHLILENKTIFKLAIEQIQLSEYATIVYGQGYKILSSIKMLEKQLPTKYGQEYYYFGDFDRSGIDIFSSLASIILIQPAKQFYQYLLTKKPIKGKQYQRCSVEKINQFLEFFEKSTQVEMLKILEQEMYLPQELISEKDIKILLKIRI